MEEVKLPVGAKPYAEVNLINPYDKYQRNKGFNFSEEKEFGNICSISANQILSCYQYADREMSACEFIQRCRNCPYAVNKSRFIVISDTNRTPNFLLKDLDKFINFNNPKSYVYFISDGEFVKIGVAKDVNSRLYELQTANARKLSVLFTIPAKSEKSAFTIENYLHREYQEFSKNGEWFDIINYIIIDEWQDIFGCCLQQ